MLVLSRRTGEQIVMALEDHLIRIRIVEVRGDKVRVGVTAPADVVVHREEVWDQLFGARGDEQLPNASTATCTPANESS